MALQLGLPSCLVSISHFPSPELEGEKTTGVLFKLVWPSYYGIVSFGSYASTDFPEDLSCSGVHQTSEMSWLHLFALCLVIIN